MGNCIIMTKPSSGSLPEPHLSPTTMKILLVKLDSIHLGIHNVHQLRQISPKWLAVAVLLGWRLVFLHRLPRNLGYPLMKALWAHDLEINLPPIDCA